MVGHLAQPKYGGQGFVLPQRDVPDFIDSSWEALPSLSSRWGGVGEKVGARGVERERKLGLICKITKDC